MVAGVALSRTSKQTTDTTKLLKFRFKKIHLTINMGLLKQKIRNFKSKHEISNNSLKKEILNFATNEKLRTGKVRQLLKYGNLQK